MKIFSKSIENGYFADRFGHHGTDFIQGKKPSRSFQISWQDIPSGTKTLALVCIDHDAIPVCGFTWIHWAVANIDPKLGELPENASQEKDLLEGVTSWNSGFLPPEWYLSKEDAIGYGGMAPPDKEHEYEVKLYALDNSLSLTKGFYLNELYKAIEGHVLAEARLIGLYKSK